MKLIIVGDTGSGEIEQYKVAKGIQKNVKENKINKIIITGDNIYEKGVKNIDDIQFINKFEKPYQKIKSQFYLLLGNHDYLGDHQAQIEYTKRSKKWNMPDYYYSIKQKPCEIFMLNTNLNELSNTERIKQLEDMIQKIKISKEKYKIVCGHHTWRSVGGHGDGDRLFEIFMQELYKQAPFDMYICGHDHCKSVIKININKKEIPVIVVGTGGKSYPSDMELNRIKGDSQLDYYSPNLGYLVLDANKKRIQIIFYNEDNNIEYTFKYTQ